MPQIMAGPYAYLLDFLRHGVSQPPAPLAADQPRYTEDAGRAGEPTASALPVVLPVMHHHASPGLIGQIVLISPRDSRPGPRRLAALARRHPPSPRAKAPGTESWRSQRLASTGIQAY